VRPAPVPPPLIVCRCSVPSRSFLLGPSALRGLHLDNPCAPAMIAATAEPEHNEYPIRRHKSPSACPQDGGEPHPGGNADEGQLVAGVFISVTCLLAELRLQALA